MARKKVQTEAKDDTGSIFDHMAEQKAPPAASPTGQEFDVGSLLAKIGAMESKLEKVTATNLALMSAAPQVQVQQPQVQEKPLPDPMDDNYNMAVEERIQRKVAQALSADRQAEQARQAQNSRVEGLWSQFETKYPDLAKDEVWVEATAAKVARQAQARGMDPNAYMFKATDMFLEDVATQMKKDFAAVYEARDEGTEQSDTPALQGHPATRTTVLGGADQGFGSTRPRVDEAKPGDMIKDIQDMQKKDGYY